MRKQTPRPSGWKPWRDQLLIELVERSKPIYAKLFKRHRPAWLQSRDSLLRFPADTLGHALGQFLQREGLDLLHQFESHDVFHVLLDYQTTVIDEVRMQFFLLGNGKRSIYALISAGIGWLGVPEARLLYRQAFQRGCSYCPIHRWKFEHLLNEPLTELRKQAEGSSTTNQIIPPF